MTILAIVADPQWQRLALYAVGGAVVLTVLFNLPMVGQALRAVFSLALLALGLYVLMERAPFDPTLSRLMARVGLDDQQVAGDEVRIRLSPDGHFWATAELNGVRRRMLIDSGATVTALSEETAQLASVRRSPNLLPVTIRTANGAVSAQTGTLDRLSLGGIEAKNLKVMVSPSLATVDVLGMNFLSELASWKVEGDVLVMTPKAKHAASPG